MHLALKAAKKEFKKLYQCVYEGHMLFLWLWYPAFCRSAARALCSVIGLDTGSDLDPNDKKDMFMRTCFETNRVIVRQLWQQYEMTDDEVDNIITMSHTDNSHCKKEDLASKYPHYDLFLFLKYAALCTANHYIEGTFSNHATALRTNMSDGRLDRKMRYQQNVVYNIKKEVQSQATTRMIEKGCKGTHVTAVGTRADCQLICKMKQQILERKCIMLYCLLIVGY